MKKIILILVFTIFLPVFARSQDIVKKEINNYLTKTSATLQELSSNLVDKYGLKDIQFLKINDGKYIPMKPDEVQKVSDVQISQDVIVIFAIIGAVLVALILLRSL